MSTLTLVRVALAAIGLIVWGYGYRVDDPVARWIGIGFLGAALLARFWRRGAPPQD
ncbi:MAG: hypothetical protein ABR499_14615 [Gemmatimonadaceae bacterium]